MAIAAAIECSYGRVKIAAMSTIGSRVATLRAARRISQAQLASEVGVKQPTIANIERGRTETIKGYVLEGLAKALNTTARYILEGEASEGGVGEAATQAELIGIWHKLPPGHQDTLLQTARGLLRAAEITPPTVSAPTKKAPIKPKQTA